MSNITLSERLKTVASFLPTRALFADIGSDHAYLPCFVCTRDAHAKAIAGELNVGPYQSAKKNVESHNLLGRIDVRQGNGLTILTKNEVNQVVVAGMGGTLITDILEAGRFKLGSVDRIVAQPNVNARVVRKWFFENGYTLTNERVVEETGHIYEILVADKGALTSPYSEKHADREFLLGPYLLTEQSEVFQKKWTEERKKLTAAVAQMKLAVTIDQQKIAHFEKEIMLIEEAIPYGTRNSRQ